MKSSRVEGPQASPQEGRKGGKGDRVGEEHHAKARLGVKCQGEVGCSSIARHKLDTGPFRPLLPPASDVKPSRMDKRTLCLVLSHACGA